MNCHPPHWLFWLLLGIAFALAGFFTYLDLRKHRITNQLIITRKAKTISDITETLTNISDYHKSLLNKNPLEKITKRQFVTVLKRTTPYIGVKIFPYNKSLPLQYIVRQEAKQNIRNLGLSNPNAKDFNEADIKFLQRLAYATSEERFSIYHLLKNDTEENKGKYNTLINKSERQTANISSTIGKEIYKYRDVSLYINNLYIIYASCPPSLQKMFFFEKRLNYAEFTDCRDRYLTNKLREITKSLEKEFGIS